MRLIDVDSVPWQECLDTDGYAEPLDKVIAVIQNMPTVEAEPVKHGHWIRTHFASPVWKCSVCGANYNRVSMIGANWCEACGAKMDEEEE